MNEGTPNAGQREFHCDFCKGRIFIAHDLPPTRAPCPYCGGLITSPALVEETPCQPDPTPGADPGDRPTIADSPPVVQKKQRVTDWIPAVLFFLILLLGGMVAVYYGTRDFRQGQADPAADSAVKDENYIRSGWQKEAEAVLRGFLAAHGHQEKLPYIMNAGALAPRLAAFYGDALIDDSDTPFEGFLIHNLSEQDKRRGIFMLTYDQPPQIDMREFFRPIAPLEVQHGVEPAEPVFSAFARASNFAMEPLRVHAFFKRTPDGLKLDWETFVQTKYRLLQDLIAHPEPGRGGVFRVHVMEDVPEGRQGDSGTRTYQLLDPAHREHSARVEVMEDSDIGRALSVINWRGSADKRPIARTATVELAWNAGPGGPVLAIRRFICWEFLGLGGEDPGAAVD
jgi:hypothetical protein